jgi:hypothetical protein
MRVPPGFRAHASDAGVSARFSSFPTGRDARGGSSLGGGLPAPRKRPRQIGQRLPPAQLLLPSLRRSSPFAQNVGELGQGAPAAASRARRRGRRLLRLRRRRYAADLGGGIPPAAQSLPDRGLFDLLAHQVVPSVAPLPY